MQPLPYKQQWIKPQQTWMRTQLVENRLIRISRSMPSNTLRRTLLWSKQPQKIWHTPAFDIGLQIYRLGKRTAKLSIAESLPMVPFFSFAFQSELSTRTKKFKYFELPQKQIRSVQNCRRKRLFIQNGWGCVRLIKITFDLISDDELKRQFTYIWHSASNDSAWCSNQNSRKTPFYLCHRKRISFHFIFDFC